MSGARWFVDMEDMKTVEMKIVEMENSVGWTANSCEIYNE